MILHLSKLVCILGETLSVGWLRIPSVTEEISSELATLYNIPSL